MSVKAFYLRGTRHGQWVFTDKNGVIRKVVKYKKGRSMYIHEFNAKGRKIRVTDKNGRSKEVEDCGCN